MEARADAAEKYERGVALRKTGLFKQAIQEFEQAAEDRTYALKAHAQIGLCHKSLGRHEEAVVTFRNALKSPQSSGRKPSRFFTSSAAPSKCWDALVKPWKCIGGSGVKIRLTGMSNSGSNS